MVQKAAYVRQRAENLLRKNFRPFQIEKILTREGFYVSKKTITTWKARFAKYGHIKLSVPGRKVGFLIVKPEHRDLIDQTLKDNDEVMTHEMQKILLEKTGDVLSLSTIKRVRRNLGWICTGPRYSQAVKEVNRAKRLEFAQAVLQDNDQFEDVIWTDETTCWMDSHSRICFRKRFDPKYSRKLKPRHKHPYKLNVWAGISLRGATAVLVFPQNMNAEFYTNEILDKGLRPFIKKQYPDGHRFMQDNDPKHTSSKATEYMNATGIRWWKTPPESPDINPIENLWHEMKHFIRKKVKPMTKDELRAGIHQFWKTVDVEKCQRYIRHIHKVLPEVVRREGRASGF